VGCAGTAGCSKDRSASRERLRRLSSDRAGARSSATARWFPTKLAPAASGRSLAAQAVLARTWAVAQTANRLRHRCYTSALTTQCQGLWPIPPGRRCRCVGTIQATQATYFSFGNEPNSRGDHGHQMAASPLVRGVWRRRGPPLSAGPSGMGRAPFAQRFPSLLPATLRPGLREPGGSAYGADHPRFRWQTKAPLAPSCRI